MVGLRSRAGRVVERAAGAPPELCAAMSDSQLTSIARLSDRLVTLKERL
jgi:hypothetical protein